MCSSKEAQLSDLIEIIEEKLGLGGTVTFTPRGISMLPMLRDGRDIVVLKKPSGRLKKFDIPLYRRANGSFVLHRVIGFSGDGSYIMCGDNQIAKEYGITDANIIAVVTAFDRKGRHYTMQSFSYRAYVKFRYCTRPVRRVYRALKHRIKNLIKK